MIRFILLLPLVILFSCVNNNTLEKKYCKIDSIIEDEQYDFVSQIFYVKYKYNTNCNIQFTSNKKLKLNDSIEINLIKVK